MKPTSPRPVLLGPDDPDPVEVVNPAAAGPFFLTCEHAGRDFPRRLGTLGLRPADLDRHITYDIGAQDVARHLSRLLDATLVLQRYSRLVVDCNRSPSAPDFIVTRSEDTDIPGNRGVEGPAAMAREREIFHPYHDAITAALDARDATGRETVLVSVHSCTAVFHGVWRPWHIGVLYERDPRYARILLDVLGTHSELVVGDNEPYFLSHEKDYAIPVHGEARGLEHVELEIRQDLIGEAAGQLEWAERVAAVLERGRVRMRKGTGS